MKKSWFLFLALSCFFNQPYLSSSSPAHPTIITDFSDLHTAPLYNFFQPTTVSELQEIVKNTKGPLSIAGGRFSQGGHIYTDRGTVIDITKLNQIISLDTQAKTITVQTGATWRTVQEYIDPYNLSVTVMQSYNNFTVGGSLSVNVHGRYLGHGPIISTILAIKIILADGSLQTASRTENNDLFYAAIGGYGALGVIVEATFQLTDNYPIERHAVLLSISDYPHYFKTAIKSDTNAIMHNADLFPPHYNTVECVTWYKTDKLPTISERLQTYQPYSTVNYVKMAAAKRFPVSQRIRPIKSMGSLNSSIIVWRNYEASYSTQDLYFPQWFSVSLLQEFFIPADQLLSFLSSMRTIFEEHEINVLNVSLRHVTPNNESILSWSTEESFAVVIFYDQWRMASSLENGDLCFKKLIQAALNNKGTYYLPYKLCATQEQFNLAYPRAPLFWDIKKKYDKNSKLSSEFLKTYFH
jgi:FAD/FMN-containing dehydrogenase